MVLNLVLLMFVTLIPFPTGCSPTTCAPGSDEHVAAAVYAATLLAMSIAFFSTYLWAARRRLFADWVGDQHVGYLVRRNGAGLLALRGRDRRRLRERAGQPRPLRPRRALLPAPGPRVASAAQRRGAPEAGV